MQIALVAVVLLAGMWFTVLKPKPAADSGSAAPVAAAPAATPSEPVAPGVKGLTSAVDKAKGASATSDAANVKIQKATGGTAAAATSTPEPKAAAPATATATAAKPVKSTAVTRAKAKATPAPKAGTKAKATDVDPSDRLLAYLHKGKTLVILFHGAGADDTAARKAVHRTALADPKHVVSAYVSIGDVGKYEAITSDVNILSAPSILVIGTNGKATLLAGYVDAATVKQAVGDARRESAADAKAKKK